MLVRGFHRQLGRATLVDRRPSSIAILQSLSAAALAFWRDLAKLALFSEGLVSVTLSGENDHCFATILASAARPNDFET